MLSTVGVSMSFGGITALNAIDLEISKGQITGIIGPNGAGKSTLLNVIGGLLRPDRGRIMFDGKDITSMPPHVRAHRGLVRTFQIARDLAELTVLENLMLARANQTGESIWSPFLSYGAVCREEREAAQRAKAILQRVNLWRLADQSARALSGGQKKLLELCRALMLNPKLILLDEPAAGVSPPMRAEIAGVIRALRDEGVTFAIVEHDMDMIANLCERVHVLAEGANLVSGTFQEVVSDQRVVRAYLGEAA